MNKKIFGLGIGAIVFIGAAIFFLAPSLTQRNQGTTHQDTEVAPAGFSLKTNENCGISFLLPNGWEDRGYLGESNIASPQDAIGERSLYFNCQYSFQEYLDNEFKVSDWRNDDNSATLSEVLTHADFASNNPRVKIIGEHSVAGQTAYEFVRTIEMPGDSEVKLYKIALEHNGRVVDIEVGNVPLAQKDQGVRQIIDSMKFEGR